MTTVTCAAAQMALPTTPDGFGPAYPWRLNAWVIAMAVASSFWCWLGRVWHQQLSEGEAWTTAGRLKPMVEWFSAVSLRLGIGMAWLMALWPVLQGGNFHDAALARWISGIAGHVMLLAALIGCARMGRRRPSILDILFTLASLIVFASVRLINPVSGSAIVVLE